MSEPIVETPPTPDQPQAWPATEPVFGEPAEPGTEVAPVEEPPNPNRHTLPSGGWVELRDLNTLKARDHKTILRGISEENQGRAIAAAIDMVDQLMILMVTAWSLPYGQDWAIPGLCIMRDPITGTPAVLDDMTAADYTTLESLVQPAQKVLFPGKADPTDAENPASPTGPANA